jgi:RNA polymerase sigma-32 factor
MRKTSVCSSPRSIDSYLKAIARYPVLAAEEERRLAREYRRDGDTRAAHRLVTANLRFVVMVANRYRSYGLRLPDLVQEGNIGLLVATQRFDPDKGFRLVSYAIWWIRACIQAHVLESWSLVKLGTTRAQRKLFFSLARARREIERLSGTTGEAAEAAAIAEHLQVARRDVEEMTHRMDGRDFSLDAPLGDEGDGATHLDLVAGTAPPQDQELCSAEERAMVRKRLDEALGELDVRERYLVEARFMSDEPMSLTAVGEHFGCSRERVRQLEARARGKLKQRLQPLALELAWPTGGGRRRGEKASGVTRA